MSRIMGKPSMRFPKRSDINRPVQAQKMNRGWKFRMHEEEKLYYPCSENKSADQRSCSARLVSHMQIVGFLMRRVIFSCEYSL